MKAQGSPVQTGFALPTVLILLVIATVVAIASVRAGVVQEQINANTRTYTLAFAGAEGAVRAGERWLYEFHAQAGGGAPVVTPDGSSGIYALDARHSQPALLDFLQPRHWHEAGAVQVPTADVDYRSASAGLPGAALAEQPRYVIEDVGKFRPPGAGLVAEGGASGGAGYEGSMGTSPGGNTDLRVFRVTGKSTGHRRDIVVTLQSTYAGRTQG